MAAGGRARSRGSPGRGGPRRNAEPACTPTAPAAVASVPAPPLPHRAALPLPPRELTTDCTLQALKLLRHEDGVFRGLSLDELEGFASFCVPLAFRRPDALFSRGEPASWFGVLLSGRAKATVQDGYGGEIPLGEHGPGALVGAARLCLLERSHTRAYTLRATEAGYIAVIGYDQMQALQRSDPRLHHALLAALLAQLSDAASAFFRSCPLSEGVRWPLALLDERRVLDLLLPLRSSGRLFAGVDYQGLCALACRLRMTQWQARDGVISRGAPHVSALLVLDGKLTGFRDAGGPPTDWYEPGDCLGLEGLFGSVRPCSVDVFAARPTFAALLVPADLRDLARDMPALASVVARSLHARFLRGLAAPHGDALALLAEAGERTVVAPGDAAALVPVPSTRVGGLPEADVELVLRAAESTAQVPRWPFITAPCVRQDTQAVHDDDALNRLLSDKPLGVAGPWPTHEPRRVDWLVGDFLSRRLLLSGVGEPYTGAGDAPQAAAPTPPAPPAAVDKTTAPHDLHPRPWLPHRRVPSPSADRSSRRSSSAPPMGDRTRHAAARPAAAAAAPPAEASGRMRIPPAGAPPRAARVAASHGSAAFFLDDRPVPMEFFGAPTDAHARGVAIVSVDPAKQQVDWACAYDVTEANRRLASNRLTEELDALPHGHVVLAAVSGEALQLLEEHALRGLERAGADPALLARRAPAESFALVGVVGAGRAAAQQRGGAAAVEAPILAPRPPASAGGSGGGDDALGPPELRGRGLDRRPARAADIALEDRQLWSLEVLPLHEEIARLHAQLKGLEHALAASREENRHLEEDRDEWQARALRAQLNREFAVAVDDLRDKQEPPWPPPPPTAAAAPAGAGVESSLRQQLLFLQQGSDSGGGAAGASAAPGALGRRVPPPPAAVLGYGF